MTDHSAAGAVPRSSYKQAGVDIKAGAEVVDRIKPHVKKTFRPGVMGGLGGFGALFDLKAVSCKDPLLVSSTDGVGTKLRIAIETGRHEQIGIDLVGMCVNDIIVQGAEPLFFLDYFATGKLDPAIAETVIAGIAEGCALSGCALIGGETAEMPGMYGEGDYDLAGFTVGVVDRARLIDGRTICAGDTIIGLPSSGPHSNGYSLIRHIAERDGGVESYAKPAPFDPSKTLAEALLTPTRLYVKPILAALRADADNGANAPLIKGMAHITGGGLTENIPRVLPDGLAARLDAGTWELLPVFRWLGRAGRLDTAELARTFNCGIGLVIVTAPEHAGAVVDILAAQGENARVIGEVAPRAEGADAVVIDHAGSWA